MKYPKYLESRKAELETIISKWPIGRSLSDVMSWILQFESSDYDLALRVLRNMNVISSDDLNSALTIAYSKLLRHARKNGDNLTTDNTIYMAIGTDGKSGAMIAYNFRMINQLSSAKFFSGDTIGLLKDGNIKNVVLVDDIIASGDQSSEQVKEIAEKVLKLGIQNIYVVSAFGFKKGIEKVSKTQVADVFSAVEYDDCDTVESMDSFFYDGLAYDKRQAYKDKLKNNYKGLGYQDIGGLIAFYYNTPNCCIGSVWKSENSWIPLFPRMFDGKAKKPELYELDKLIAQSEKDGEQTSVTQDSSQCNIYVEGKVMELLIRELAERYNRFDYPTLSVVSIGPFYSSDLIEALRKHSPISFFVTNEPEDSKTPHATNIKNAVKDANLVRLRSVMEYFDTEKIKTSEKFSKVIDRSIFDDEVSEETRNSLLEIKLFKPQFRSDNMKELINNCADEDRIKELIEKFKKQEQEE